MSSSGTPPARARGYALGASLVALVAGLAGVVCSRLGLPGPLAWILVGWTGMAAIGIGSGAWMAAAYGKPGPGFLAAMVAGMLGRLAVASAGAVAAVRWGGEGLWGYLAGWALGFVPLQVYEVAYFVRAGHGSFAGSDAGGAAVQGLPDGGDRG